MRVESRTGNRGTRFPPPRVRGGEKICDDPSCDHTHTRYFFSVFHAGGVNQVPRFPVCLSESHHGGSRCGEPPRSGVVPRGSPVPRLPVLAVDPGATTAGAALLDGRTVVAWWAWTWLRRASGPGIRHRPGAVLRGVYRLRSDGVDGPAQTEAPTLVEVAQVIGRVMPVGSRLVIEQPYAEPPRRGRRVDPQDAIVLAEAAGIMLGALGPKASIVDRPLASTWRAPMGWAGLGAGDAESRAVEWARRAVSWPSSERLRSLDHAELGAVCESACMAIEPREAA